LPAKLYRKYGRKVKALIEIGGDKSDSIRNLESLMEKVLGPRYKVLFWEAACGNSPFGEGLRRRRHPMIGREKYHHLPRPKPSLNIV
jgi:hypothetical protein